MKKITDPIGHSQQAIDAMKMLYASELVSVTLFGSAAGGDFNPETSDINLLIILTSMDPQLIARSADLQKRLEKQRFARPLFMDKAYIASSLDSYPMEFLDMKGCRTVLFGEDVLASIAPEQEHLRLQVERELKGKWLHLVQEYTAAQKNAKQLAHLTGISLKSFMPVFRALLILKGTEIPVNRAVVLAGVESAYTLAGTPLQQAASFAFEHRSIAPENVFLTYLTAIKSLIDIIDNQ